MGGLENNMALNSKQEHKPLVFSLYGMTGMLTFKTSFCFLLLFSSISAKSIDVEVTCDPSLPVKNLLSNSSFENGAGAPENWSLAERSVYFRWTREYLWITKVQKVEGKGRNGGACVRQEVNTDSVLSELFIRQAVTVKPDTLYRAEIWAKIKSGRAYLHIIDSRIKDESSQNAVYKYLISWHDSPLIPDFIDKEWTRSPPADQWNKIEAEMGSGKGDVMYFDFGSYYGKGSVDYDDAFFGEALTDMTVTVKGEDVISVDVNDEFGKLAWTGKETEKNGGTYIFKIGKLKTSSKYKITVKAKNTQEKSVWYPAN